MSISSPWLGLVAAIFIAMASGICGLIAIGVQTRPDLEPESFDLEESRAFVPPRPHCRPTLKSRES